jgi:pimeloyl-ACP methyl ester carboxylesterase
VVFEAMDKPFAAEWRETVRQMRALADQGRAEDAVRLFLGTAGTPEEEAIFSGEAAFISKMARYLPVDLAEFEEVPTDEAVSPTAPSALARIAVPVLLMRGACTELPWFAASVRHIASHVPDCRVQEVAGAAHMAAATVPEALAGILSEFFGPAEVH